MCCSVLQCVAVCFSVLQCVTVCCSVLQWLPEQASVCVSIYERVQVLFFMLRERGEKECVCKRVSASKYCTVSACLCIYTFVYTHIIKNTTANTRSLSQMQAHTHANAHMHTRAQAYTCTPRGRHALTNTSTPIFWMISHLTPHV